MGRRVDSERAPGDDRRSGHRQLGSEALHEILRLRIRAARANDGDLGRILGRKCAQERESLGEDRQISATIRKTREKVIAHDAFNRVECFAHALFSARLRETVRLEASKRAKVAEGTTAGADATR